EEITAKLDDWQGRLEKIPEDRRAEAQRLLTAARQALNATRGDALQAAQKKEQAEHDLTNQQAGHEFAQADNATEAGEESVAKILKPLFELIGETKGLPTGEVLNIPFSVAGHRHTLFVENPGDQLEVFMASDKERVEGRYAAVSAILKDYKTY